jgi:hypothetical protein
MLKLLPRNADPTVGSRRVHDRARLVDRDDVDELGVHPRAVQTLLVVLDQDLPIGLDDGRCRDTSAQVAEVQMFEERHGVETRRERIHQGCRVGRQIDEHEPVPRLASNTPQRQ